MSNEKKSLGPLTLAYPLPAFLVGTYDEQGTPNIMTAAWGGICSSEPPALAVSVRASRWTYAAINTRKAFTVSIPGAAMVAQTDYAGIVSGKTGDKFAACGLTATKAEFVDAPYVAQCPVVLELELLHTLDLGSHTQFIGKIIDVKADVACLGENGKPVMEKIDPILYDAAARAYYRVGEEVAKAYSIGTTLKK